MTLATNFLAKDTGKLRVGSTVRFIGRELIHEGTHIVNTTGTSTPTDLEITFPDDWDAAQEFHQCRKVIGKLQWLVNVRPDLAFAVEILARETSNVIPDSWRKVKHLLRYLQGISEMHFTVKPNVALQANDKHELHIYSDSDWAGGLQTRKSIS
eukprot:12882545-Alexandrium_andersonii.AAC.1